MAEKQNPRQIAVEILCDIDRDKAYSNILLRGRLKRVLDARDRGFITELVYGVISYQRYLDYVLDQFSKIKTKKMTYVVLNILRTAAYQILKLDKVPQSAAVNEAVNLTKQMANRGSVAFVNGVLRSVCTKYDSISWPKDPLNALSTKESFPFWMAGLLYKRIGRECDALLPALNQPPHIILRANTRKISRDDLIEKLKAEGISAEKTLLADGICCGGFSVGESALYKEGYFSVQDTAAQLSVRVLSPQCGDRVLDMCAAPGGKTCYMAEMMENDGHIVALDIYEHKKELIDSQARRLGISIIDAIVADAITYETDCLFDKILVDAPCSGLGIIARKPEIKWNRTREDIDTFSSIQTNIINKAATLLAAGGEMVYSTCTLTRQENEQIVENFLKEHDDFSLLSFKDTLPTKWQDGAENGYITLWPHIHHTDGFFIAKFKKA